MELIVALAIVSLMAAIAAPFASEKSGGRANPVDEFLRLRHDAVRARSPIRRQLSWGDATTQATAYPDGTILVDTVVPIDRYTGGVTDARR